MARDSNLEPIPSRFGGLQGVAFASAILRERDPSTPAGTVCCSGAVYCSVLLCCIVMPCCVMLCGRCAVWCSVVQCGVVQCSAVHCVDLSCCECAVLEFPMSACCSLLQFVAVLQCDAVLQCGALC